MLNLLAGFEQPEHGGLFQQPQIFPWLDVIGNVCLARQPASAVQALARTWVPEPPIPATANSSAASC